MTHDVQVGPHEEGEGGHHVLDPPGLADRDVPGRPEKQPVQAHRQEPGAQQDLPAEGGG